MNALKMISLRTCREIFRNKTKLIRMMQTQPGLVKHVNDNMRFFSTEIKKADETIHPKLLSPFAEVRPEELDLSTTHKELPPTFNLAAYANKSKTLQELIKLGVNLSKLDSKPKIAQYILQSDFDKHIAPYIQFLHDLGIEPDGLGRVITKYSAIFMERIEDLQVRINYLESKKFTKEMITLITYRQPRWLSRPVETIDKKLGFYQQQFELTGDEVRTLMVKLPDILGLPTENTLALKYVFLDEMEFNKYQTKEIILGSPKLLKKDPDALMDIFFYITREMQVQSWLLVKQHQVFDCRKFIIKQRHLFLKFVGRAQYNPRLPGYVSLEALVTKPDAEFCTDIAKTSIHVFNEFLKTM